jgi:guanyl-specific ribonuclease Sa
MTTRSVGVLLAMTLSACGGGTAATTIASTTTAPVATTTSTTLATTTSTMAATTTSGSSTIRLPGDACDQIDVEAIRAALGVDEVRAGSPFGVQADGALAQCRFGVTYSGNFGSAFNVTMLAPNDAGAYEYALSLLPDIGDGSPVPGLGVNATVHETEFAGPLMLVEYTNGTAAYVVADSEEVYGAGSPDTALQAILEDVVGPIMLGIG